METPLVSIVITCYNQAPLIHKAIESVLQQTHNNWECIVVDDGSTDNSIHVVADYCKQDTRIKQKTQPNQGVSAARNSGFKEVKGEFLQFLDGDDWLLPEKIEKQVAYFTTHPEVDICYSNHQYYNETTHKTKFFEFEKLSNKPLKQFLYGWHHSVAIPPHAFLYRRGIWKQDELPYAIDYKDREEDWIFHVMTAMKDISYGHIDEVLCTYFINDQSFTNSILNSCVNTIKAANYINSLLSKEEQENFYNETLKKTLIRYKESEKSNILRSSINWRIGFVMSKPLHPILKLIKQSKTK
jgi:hypothetical protein